MARKEKAYTKTKTNNTTEKEAVRFLREHDPRFQRLPAPVRNRILTTLGLQDEFTCRVFDLVWSEKRLPELTVQNVEDHLEQLVFVEVKSTKKPIRDGSLNQFFFGATQKQYDFAAALPGRVLFAFVVLNSENVFGQPFYRILTPEQLAEKTRPKRIQYQVNMRTDMEPELNWP